MNFKSWLVISEAKKDINLSNPNLTAAIPQLNTSLSNPSLTTTIPPLNASVSNPNLTTKISNRELASNQRVKKLAIEYIKAKGFAKLPKEFKNFLNSKKIAYKDLIDGTKNSYSAWYPSDIKIAKDHGLPNNWMLFVDLETESNQKVEKLAIEYIKAKGFAKLPIEFKRFLTKKRMAYRYYKDGKENPDLKNPDVNWYPSDIKIAKDHGLPNNWMLFVDLEKESNQKVKKLAIRFKELKGKYPSEFSSFLNSKRLAYQDYKKDDGTKTTTHIWYPSDIEVAEKNGLPNNWMLFVDLETESNQKVEKLAIEYIKAKGFAKLPITFKWFLTKKRMAYRYYKDGKENPDLTWYPSDIKIAKDHGLPKNWMLFVSDEEESNKQVKALGIRYQELGEKYPPEFKDFLKNKRTAYQDYKKDDGTKTTTHIWYPSDIEVAEKNGLPNNWMGPQMEILKSRNEQKSNDRLEELAIYFGRNGSAPSTSESNKENKSLAGWYANKKSRNSNPHEESDDKAWAELVALSKSPNWIDPVTGEPFPHDLPEDWRYIEPDQSNFSIPAKKLGKILKKYFDDVVSEYQDIFCVSKTGRCYRFDYYFEYNDKIYFVEYHGEQHYYPIYFGSKKDTTKQERAKLALDAFKANKKNDRKKYNYCESNGFPLLVIPYWTSPVDFEKIVLNFFKHDNVFDDLFANPLLDVPPKYKAYHDKMYAKYLADLKSTELVEPTKTFEQFLINKNFINK